MALRYDEPLRATFACPHVLRKRFRIVRRCGLCWREPSWNELRRTQRSLPGAWLSRTIAYTSVSPQGRTFASQLLLTPAAAPPDLHTIARAVHAHGALLSSGLARAGSFADVSIPGSCAHRAIAPSPVFELATLSRPPKRPEADIDGLVADFAEAARIVRGPWGGGRRGSAPWPRVPPVSVAQPEDERHPATAASAGAQRRVRGSRSAWSVPCGKPSAAIAPYL